MMRARERSAAPKPALAYVLTALFMLNALNFTDRLLFNVLQEVIKTDLGLSDFQLGLLGGPAFALLYVLAGFPIARFAESHNRVSIISIVFAIWSGMTAFCGIAASFTQMAIGRAGVSVGEAGCTPAAHSLISDFFSPARRTTAISVFTAGAPVGALFAAIAGTWFAQLFGWRAAFVACGALGIAIALVFRLTIPEPARSHAHHDAPKFGAAVRTLLGKPSFVAVAAAGGIAGIASVSNSQYMVSFLMRTHGMDLAEAGLLAGILIGVVGIVVTLSAGPIIDIAQSRFPGIRTWLPAGSLMCCGACYALAFLVPDRTLCIALLLAASFAQQIYLPAMFTVGQDVAPPHMRATASALIIGVVAAFGYGLGPPIVGLASDMLAGLALAEHGGSAAACAHMSTPACVTASMEGLRLSLSVVSLAFVLAGLAFALSGRTIAKDIHR